MKLVTISSAKANLSALIEAAENGQQVLIMRGSQPAVTLTPVREEDLEITPRIPISALADFDAEIQADRKAGRLKKLGTSAKEAAGQLSQL
jgi:prevent-host-death family protein